MSENISISIGKNENLYGSFYEPGNRKQKYVPLIIFVHGFKGFKNWGGFPYMLKRFSEFGYSAVCFNFSHNGVTPDNPEEFTRLDLFAKNTFSRELDELCQIIDYFCNNAKKYKIDRERIIITGHSRGGGISIITAHNEKRVRSLVTLSSVSKFDRYSQKLKIKWRKAGFIEVENSRTKQIMRLNVSLLDDLEQNKEKLDILSAVSKLEIPALFIHGKEDLAVRYKEAKEIYDKSNKKLSELFLVENSGHTYGIVHPFTGTTPAFEKVINKIRSFLNSHS